MVLDFGKDYSMVINSATTDFKSQMKKFHRRNETETEQLGADFNYEYNNDFTIYPVNSLIVNDVDCKINHKRHSCKIETKLCSNKNKSDRQKQMDNNRITSRLACIDKSHEREIISSKLQLFCSNEKDFRKVYLGYEV